jgi:hypothetical protein
MRPTPALTDALDRAYAAFGAEPRPRQLDSSPLRDGVAILRGLISAPLRDLPAEIVGPYSGWAVTTVGSGQDYRYFLPRILELAVLNDGWLGTSPAVIASRLQMARWRDWSAAQIDTVIAVFALAFDAALAAEPDEPDDPRDWLCGLARLEAPLDRALDTWRASASAGTCLRLAHFVMAWRDGVDGPSFWDDVRPEIQARVERWTVSRDTQQQLEPMLAIVADHDRRDIERALEALRTAPATH